MLDNINILKLASSMARHAASRHELLSQNIANADTNNYKAKDLEAFSEAYTRMKDLDPLSDDKPAWRVETISAQGLASPNGNTVSLEDQMMRSVEAQSHHETATLIYKKSIDILRLSLGRGL